MLKLTEKALAEVAIPDGKTRVTIWEKSLPGFGIVVGRRSWVFIVRTRVNGKQKLVTIGRHGGARPDGSTWNIPKARKAAIQVMGKLAAASGSDGYGSSHTLRAGLELHVKNLRRRNRSEKTIKTIESEVSRHFAAWLDRPIVEITGETLESIFQDTLDNAKPRRGSVNPPGLALAIRLVSHISVLWNALDRKHDLPGKNPARRVERGELKPKNERINNDEFPAWYAKVLTLSPVRRDLQLFTLFTAMRASSVQPLRWEGIDFENRIAHVWAKGDKPYSVPLSQAAMAILNRRREENSEFDYFGGDGGWVFPSLAREKPVRVIHVAESKETENVDGSKVKFLPGLHPLRRTHNSVAAEIGIITEHRERLLNHNGQGVNVRVYSRPQNWDFIAECQERISKALLARLEIDLSALTL